MEDDVHAARGRLDGAQIADVPLDGFQMGGVGAAELEVPATWEPMNPAPPVTRNSEDTRRL